MNQSPPEWTKAVSFRGILYKSKAGRPARVHGSRLDRNLVSSYPDITTGFARFPGGAK